MIETLKIEAVAIVDRAVLEFGPGLNVLTGETGTGKSIVLGALGLLAGGRASAESVREGAEQGLVEAVFRTERLPELEALLQERGLGADAHELMVARSIAPGGRSRAFVAGRMVPVSTLAELFAGRLEISSQHDSQSLLRPELHGRLLDGVGGLHAHREGVAETFAALRALDTELARLRAEAQDRERRRDFLSFQVREIDAAELDATALEDLRAERGRLLHAERLGEEGGALQCLLSGDPTGAEEAAAADRLGEGARRLAALSQLDPTLAALADRIAAAESEVRDVALELERYTEGIEADPGRLSEVEERLHLVTQLLRKYGPDVAGVLRFRDEAAAELAAVEGAGEREAGLVAERAPLEERLGAAARVLSAGREKAARRLARSVQTALRELAMPQARFSVGLEPVPAPEGFPCAAAGAEAPEFLFSANAGEALRPLRKVASGGELSRAFLALKNALREADAGMVLVFDEVDAGVGGRAADRVGRSLAELARTHQVLCITHLPQIAALADVHFRVEKVERKGRTQARMQRVEGDERVEEIARMAGGAHVGEATRQHARELLASSRPSGPVGVQAAALSHRS